MKCATLWTTVYLDDAVRQLEAQGFPVRKDDIARLSPLIHSHLGVHSTYTFAPPELAPGAIRDLRDPNISTRRRRHLSTSESLTYIERPVDDSGK